MVLASFFFYGFWFPPYIFLLITSGVIDYFCSRKINNDSPHKRKWLWLSLSTNLGLLGYFKYANFFLDQAQSFLTLTGIQLDVSHIDVILPMGISFYTFQSMSYTIDVYRGKLKACHNFIDFFVYLSFFPQLVAGPIVKAIHFLPQLVPDKPFISAEQLQDGLYRITRGLFLKVVIADNIAPCVQLIFSSQYDQMSILQAWTGCIFFGVQIFCDFAGYSDIAIGLSALFGFKINENFNNPNFSTSPTNYWQRWHISLSTWFRDYVFLPIVSRYRSNGSLFLAVFILFFLSGLWHGADVKFITWGLYHGALMVIELLLKKYCRAWHLKLNRVRGMQICYIILMFIAILPSWAPFRAPTHEKAMELWSIMSGFNASPLVGYNITPAILMEGTLWAGVFLLFQLVCAFKELKPYKCGRSFITKESWIYFCALILLPGTPVDFIYFQF